jgi:hypothetical protein
MYWILSFQSLSRLLYTHSSMLFDLDIPKFSCETCFWIGNCKTYLHGVSNVPYHALLCFVWYNAYFFTWGQAKVLVWGFWSLYDLYNILNLSTLNFVGFTLFHLVLYQHFTSFDPLLQISAPRHLILQDRAIQTSVQATRNGEVHLEEQERSR